jgi:hypothetical protein
MRAQLRQQPDPAEGIHRRPMMAMTGVAVTAATLSGGLQHLLNTENPHHARENRVWSLKWGETGGLQRVSSGYQGRGPKTARDVFACHCCVCQTQQPGKRSATSVSFCSLPADRGCHFRPSGNAALPQQSKQHRKLLPHWKGPNHNNPVSKWWDKFPFIPPEGTCVALPSRGHSTSSG